MPGTRRQLRAAGTLTVCLAFLLASCGTVLYPERRGQPAGRLDVGVIALDGLGLLLFLVPGVIAYAVVTGLIDESSSSVRFSPFFARRGKHHRENGEHESDEHCAGHGPNARGGHDAEEGQESLVRLDSAIVAGDLVKDELHADREAEHGPEEHPQESPQARDRVAHRFSIAHRAAPVEAKKKGRSAYHGQRRLATGEVAKQLASRVGEPVADTH
jgi:hypothetical protein